VPPSLVEVFVRTKALTTRHQSLLDQATLCDFIEQGHLGRHLRRMRKIYEERFLLLRESVQLHLAGLLELTDIEAGLQTIGRITATSPDGLLSAEAIALRAEEQHIDVVPLSRYCHSVSTPEGLQVGFAAVHEKHIAPAVVSLARIFELLCKERLASSATTH
jgi:GntR family transcriptional regulator/MocR family aminotransferase